MATRGTCLPIGQGIRDPRSGRIYKHKKSVYYLYIPVGYLPLFHRYIGFSTRRRQRRLLDAIRQYLSSTSFSLQVP